MSPKVFSEAWSVPLPDRLDDRARDALSDTLGLRFHGFNQPYAHTVAHRFVADDRDILLRVVRRSPHEHAVQLVAFGAEIVAEQALELKRSAIAAIAALSSEAPALESPVAQAPGWLSQRLASLAEGLFAATALLGARLQPIEVLGEASEVVAGPMELVLAPGTEQLLGPDIQRRAIFDGAVVCVWLSGTWDVVRPSRLLLYAVDPDDDRVVEAEAGIEPGRGRVRLELPWPHGSPPAELLIAVVPRE
jgi:hypothetical protein